MSDVLTGKAGRPEPDAELEGPCRLGVNLGGETYTVDIDALMDDEVPGRLIWTARGIEAAEALQERLWRRVTHGPMPEVIAPLGLKRLRAIAANLNNADEPACALPVIEYCLAHHGPDPYALAVLCSVLRKLGRPAEALRRTEDPRFRAAPLSTSRAAAWCDLGNLDKAREEAYVARSLSTRGTGGPLIGVLRRIKEKMSRA